MASQGPLSPTSAVDDASIGTVAWTNPGNVLASDDARAEASLLEGENSHYLTTGGYGFAIPGGATIDGIKVELEESQQQATGTFSTAPQIQILKAGVWVGDVENWIVTGTVADSYRTFGGPTSLWGTTWTPANINHSGFGVRWFTGERAATSGTGTYRVDHVRITVYYTGGDGFGPLLAQRRNRLVRAG